MKERERKNVLKKSNNFKIDFIKISNDPYLICLSTKFASDKQKVRQIDRQTNRQSNKQTDRQALKYFVLKINYNPILTYSRHVYPVVNIRLFITSQIFQICR